MTTSDKEDSYPEGTLPSRVVPPQPAYNPSGWPANPSTAAPSVLTPGQPVAPLAPPPPASFSFGDGPAAQPPQAAAGASSLALTTTGPEAQQLEMELAAARDELKALHEMLEDLPEIFERKFQQRLATVMEHQKHLLDDNQALRERLYSLNPAAADGPPPPGAGRPQPLLLPTVARKEGWGQALKKAMRLGGPDSNGRPGERSTQKISRHDDGRPITA